jgi:hypothetical protein
MAANVAMVHDDPEFIQQATEDRCHELATFRDRPRTRAHSRAFTDAVGSMASARIGSTENGRTSRCLIIIGYSVGPGRRPHHHKPPPLI